MTLTGFRQLTAALTECEELSRADIAALRQQLENLTVKADSQPRHLALLARQEQPHLPSSLYSGSQQGHGSNFFEDASTCSGGPSVSSSLSQDTSTTSEGIPTSATRMWQESLRQTFLRPDAGHPSVQQPKREMQKEGMEAGEEPAVIEDTLTEMVVEALASGQGTKAEALELAELFKRSASLNAQLQALTESNKQMLDSLTEAQAAVDASYSKNDGLRKKVKAQSGAGATVPVPAAVQAGAENVQAKQERKEGLRKQVAALMAEAKGHLVNIEEVQAANTELRDQNARFQREILDSGCPPQVLREVLDRFHKQFATGTDKEKALEAALAAFDSLQAVQAAQPARGEGLEPTASDLQELQEPALLEHPQPLDLGALDTSREMGSENTAMLDEVMNLCQAAAAAAEAAPRPTRGQHVASMELEPEVLDCRMATQEEYLQKELLQKRQGLHARMDELLGKSTKLFHWFTKMNGINDTLAHENDVLRTEVFGPVQSWDLVD